MQPPPDWEEAPPCSVLGRFLVCKTPLDWRYAVSPARAWTVEHALARAGRSPPSLVVDLTNGTGYYDHASRPWGEHVAVRRIRSPGHRDAVPSEDAWHSFVLSMRHAPAGAVVVHCTHGCNRSGWFVCRWLHLSSYRDTMAECISAFADARGGDGIYKEEFVTDLLLRVGEPSTAPPRWPAWRAPRAQVESLPLYWRDRFNARAAVRPPPRAARAAPDTAHEVGLVSPFVLSITRSVPCMAAFVRDVASRGTGRPPGEFGGALPVALGRADVASMDPSAWSVSWKADGVHHVVVMMPIVRGAYSVFGINRLMEVRHLGDMLPGADARACTRPAVACAELVLGAGESCVLWVHDLLMDEGEVVAQEPHCMRASRLKGLLDSFGEHPVCFGDRMVHLARKHWWPAGCAAEVAADPYNRPSDGLIFQLREAPFRPGRDYDLKKWKRPDDLTVDFLVTQDDRILLADGDPPCAESGGLLAPDPAWRGEARPRGGRSALGPPRRSPAAPGGGGAAHGRRLDGARGAQGQAVPRERARHVRRHVAQNQRGGDPRRPRSRFVFI